MHAALGILAAAMTALNPKGERLRRAVRWISDKLREKPERSVAPLIDEAGLRFDLSPLESEYLYEVHRNARSRNQGE